MKQTAVEWLNSMLTFEDAPIIPKDLLEAAKQMELAQRIEDYNNGHIDRQKNLFRLPKRNTPIPSEQEDMSDWDVTLNDGLENL